MKNPRDYATLLAW